MQTARCKAILKEKVQVPLREEQCLPPVFTQYIAWGNWLRINGGLGLLLFKDINYFVRKHSQPLKKMYYSASLRVSSLWSVPIRDLKEFMAFATLQICRSKICCHLRHLQSAIDVCAISSGPTSLGFFCSCFQKTHEDRLSWNTSFLKCYLGLNLSNKISSRQKKNLDIFIGLILNNFFSSHSCCWRSPLISEQLSSEHCKNLIFAEFRGFP